MGDDPEGRAPVLPPAIELAWGLRGRASTTGARRGLSLEKVVAAGIKVALTEGIGAVSMGRVAAELGVATMSLYRYVSAKDELLTLMADAAAGPPPAAVLDQPDWRAGLTAWAIAVRAAYLRHPWALRVPIDAPPLGPNNIAWLEAALRALTGTPLSEREKLSTVLLLGGFVRNEATLRLDVAAAAAGAEPTMSGYGAMLALLTDALHFPALHKAIASGALDSDEGPDYQFEYGLGRILDGVDALISRFLATPSPHDAHRASPSSARKGGSRDRSP